MGGQRIEVVAFDPVDVGYWHAMFNAAVLQALDAASMVERIHVVVAKSALESRPFDEVRRLDKVRVAGSLRELPLSRGRWRELKRRLGCYFQMARSVRWSRSVVCMYLASDNLIGPLFLLLDRLVRGRRAYVILHSNAQSVRKSLAIRLLWGAVFRVGVQPIVLARWVYSFYTQVYPRIRFHLIPHPSYLDATGRDAENRVVQNPEPALPVYRYPRYVFHDGGVSAPVHIGMFGGVRWTSGNHRNGAVSGCAGGEERTSGGDRAADV